MLILEHVDTDLEFGVGLARAWGNDLWDKIDNNRKRVLKKTYHGMLFARYFGQSVGPYMVKCKVRFNLLLCLIRKGTPSLPTVWEWALVICMQL